MIKDAQRSTIDKAALPLFLTIAQAAKVTGLSQYFIRQSVRDGSIPSIQCGSKYMIGTEKMLSALDKMLGTAYAESNAEG